MAPTRSQLEAINPEALHDLAAQVANVHNELSQHAATHDQVWRNLDDAWRGSAADAASDSVDKHMRWLRANAEGVEQLHDAVTSAAADLGTAKANVLATLADLEARGYTVGDDWSIQPPAGTSATAPAAQHPGSPAATVPASAQSTTPAAAQPDDMQDGADALRSALSAYDNTEKLAGQTIQAAYGNIVPIDQGKIGNAQDIPNNWDPSCGSDPTWDAFSDQQKNNARDIYAVGRCLGMSPQEIQVALMAALLESHMFNLGDPSMDGSTDKADTLNGKICMGHTADNECGGGIFQQHPSNKGGDWGTTDEIMDPVQAATMFYVGRCAPNGKLAPGIKRYTRDFGITIDPSAPNQYLYSPTTAGANIPIADAVNTGTGWPASAPPWAIAQAIQHPSWCEPTNGGLDPADNYGSYQKYWNNAVDLYGKVDQDQAQFVNNSNYCSIRQGRVNNIVNQNTCQ